MSNASLRLLGVLLLASANAIGAGGNIMVNTEEDAVLLRAHLQELQGSPPHDSVGMWLNALPRRRQADIDKAAASLPPHKKNALYESEFDKAYQSFGNPLKQPFCVLSHLASWAPLMYENNVYRWQTTGSPAEAASFDGNAVRIFDADENVFKINGKEGIEPLLPAAKLGDAGYAAIIGAAKKLQQNAYLRQCYRFIKYEKLDQIRVQRSGISSRTYYEYLSAEIVDKRSNKTELNIPLSWLGS